jgi:hypothetical protein
MWVEPVVGSALDRSIGLQDRALVNEVFEKVASSGNTHEETRGSLDKQDALFGTTIEPSHLMGWPVHTKSGGLYGVIVLHRCSIEPFSNLERKILAAVAARIGLHLKRAEKGS